MSLHVLIVDDDPVLLRALPETVLARMQDVFSGNCRYGPRGT